MLFLTFFGVSIILGLYILLYTRRRLKKPCVAVLVLGDLGRSPRMQNHALALAEQNFHVDLIGTLGTPCPLHLASHPNIVVTYLNPSFADKYLSKTCPYIIFALVKMWEQTFALIKVLLTLETIDCLIVQTPPALPTLIVAWLIARLRGSKFIIDWHNYGWSLLRNSGKGRLTVMLYSYLEAFFGKFADAAFCVSAAMRKDLLNHSGWAKIKSSITTVYDRPLIRHNGILEMWLRHRMSVKYFSKYPFQPGQIVTEMQQENAEDFNFPMKNTAKFYEDSITEKIDDENFLEAVEHAETLFTSCSTSVDSKYNFNYKKDRPALMITSTSWTDDEDFDILIEALTMYDKAKSGSHKLLPDLFILMTGVGSGRQAFYKKVELATWEHIFVKTTFVPYTDYFKLLACADLGLSFHTSSSGLDLPMKILDMFSVNLPVLSCSFPAISELCDVSVCKLFHNAEELFSLLIKFLDEFPSEELQNLRQGAIEAKIETWFTSWDLSAGQVIRNILGVRPKQD